MLKLQFLNIVDNECSRHLFVLAMIEDRYDNMKGLVIKRILLTLILFLIYVTPVFYFAAYTLHTVQELLHAAKCHHHRPPPS